MYKITNSDLQDLEMLKNIKEEEYSYYQQLFELEIAGKKNEEKYKAIIERIKDIIILEDSIFSRLVSSKEQIDAITNKINQDWNFNNGGFLTDLTLNREQNIKCSINNRFNSYILDYYLHHPESRFSLSIDAPEITEYISRLNLCVATFRQYLITDYSKLSLALMERIEENNPQNKWAKYALSFQIKDVERELINNGFNVERNPFLINGVASQMFADIKNQDFAKKDFLENSIDYSLPSLAYLDDYSLSDPENVLLINWITCGIRSFIILMDKDTEQQTIKKLEDLLVMLQSKRGYYRVIGAIENILANYQKDKEIPQIVGLNL